MRLIVVLSLVGLMVWLGLRQASGHDHRVALALVAVPVLVFGFRELHDRRLEDRLAAAASVLAGRPVEVACQSAGGAWVDGSGWLGHVDYGPDGKPADVVSLAHATCGHLDDWLDGDRGAGVRDQVIAVHVLAHEAEHAAGRSAESEAECRSLQRTAEAARLLGASDAQAAAVAAAYARDVYPSMDPAYVSPGCRDGGSLDLRPADPSWP